MKIFYRDCVKDFVLEALNGDRLELVKGKEYITSPIYEDKQVTVFTRYWVKVPADLFDGEREKPKQSLYEKPPLGLKPKSIADEERHDEVCQAIIRYMTSKKPIPDKWLKEYQGWFRGE